MAAVELATALVVAVSLSGSASAASVTPILVDPWTSGNAGTECTEATAYTGISYAYAYKIDSWSTGISGSYTATFQDGHSNTITISNNDGTYFDWSATNPIGAVIVKGGTVANIFKYVPQASSDTGLTTPTNPRSGRPYEVSHATFCWNPEEHQCFGDETGWAAGTRYVTRGNWATYTPYPPSSNPVKLYAGQTKYAGQVSFSAADPDGNVTINISLNPGWFFSYKDPSGLLLQESLHIQGYDSQPPAVNPAPGLFDNKYVAQGTYYSVSVPEANYYGVHVALKHEVPCP